MSTPNRTTASRLLLVEAAERLGQVPRGTHDWNQFLTPDELTALLTDAGFKIVEMKGIALRVDNRDRVTATHARAQAAGATISQGPEESRVAYSFTAVDPDGNQWWVHAETGFLDQLRARQETAV